MPARFLNREVAKFLTVGAVSAVVDFGVLYLAALAVGARAGFFVAYPSGVLTHFLLNKYWTFGCTRTDWAKQVVQYAVSVAAAFVVQAAVYALALRWSTGHLAPEHQALFGKACAIPPSTIVCYFLLKLGAFRGPRTGAGTPV